MTDTDRADPELRVLVLAPTGKDAALARDVLARAGVGCRVCPDLDRVCAELGAGAGAVLLAEEAVGHDRTDGLSAWLARQPPWSDLPVLVLARPGADSPAVGRAIELLGNVTVLERPTRVAALVTAARTALRARRRQYQTRDHLAERERVAAELRRSESNLRDFFDNAPIGLHWVGPDGTVLRVNRTELDMLGYAPDEYVGRHVAEFHADADVIGDILCRLTRGETLDNYEARLRTKGGDIRHVLISSNVLREGDRFVHTRCFTRDITERKRAEERLRASEERRRLALDAAELGAWHVDPATMTLTTDERFRAIFGVAADYLTYEQAVAVIHPDDRPRVREAVAAATRPDDPAPYAIEYRVVHPDGSARWVFAKGRANVAGTGPDRRLVSFDGTVADITDRKRAEEALRASEERLRFLDALGEATRAAAEPAAVMATAARLLGEHLGVTRCAYADVEDDNDRFTIRDDWRAAGAATTAGTYRLDLFGPRAAADMRAGRTLVVRDVDAELVPAGGADTFNAIGIKAVVCCPLVKDGCLRAMMAVHHATPRDWTADEIALVREAAERSWAHIERVRSAAALRESEERFRTAVAATSDILWTNDAAGKMTGEQPGWGTFTGQSFDQYQGYGWAAAVHPDDARPTIEAWERAVADRRMFVFEHRVRRRDGAYRLCSIRAVPVLDGGVIREWVGVHTDITDQRELERALRDADRRKDEFLATLAHELRNPLAPIRNSLHILRLAGGNGPTADRIHAMMERQVNHMVRLVDDLLEVSRITRGKIELRKEPVELAAVVRTAVEASRPLLDAAGHRLAIALPPDPLTLDADPVRLAQVFSNLLNNSAKYTDPGGQVWLSARRDGGEVVVSVRDTGVGIPADMLPRVFDMFTQVDRDDARGQGGLGIGLTLVRSLAEMHGGRVEARSGGPGTGSEFVVRLPLAGGRAPAGGAEPGRPPAALAPRRVLVVDDNRDAAESLGVLLGLLGAEVRVAYNGPDALAALDDYRPAVVLLDIGMPGMDGHEVARRIRQRPEARDVTLVALTGWGQEDDRRRTGAAGFDHHLVKPADLAALGTLLHSLG